MNLAAGELAGALDELLLHALAAQHDHEVAGQDTVQAVLGQLVEIPDALADHAGTVRHAQFCDVVGKVEEVLACIGGTS